MINYYIENIILIRLLMLAVNIIQLKDCRNKRTEKKFIDKLEILNLNKIV